MTEYFDPLDYDNLGASIARALEDRPVVPLPELEPFDGAGIYALYYTGDHKAYNQVAFLNRQVPGTRALYIGKAETENARKGDPQQAHRPVGTKLFDRVKKHKRSIDAAENLSSNDFQVRVLAVAPTWIPLAEVVAIRMHNPVWNVLVDGLGNNDPGRGRYAGMRPRWDTLHPGRAWADRLTDRNENADDIIQDIQQYFSSRS